MTPTVPDTVLFMAAQLTDIKWRQLMADELQGNFAW